MERFRRIVLGSLVGLVVCTAVLVLHFVFQLPTSDYRTRLYFLLFTLPASIGVSYLAALLFVAGAALGLAGWRGWELLNAAALSALVSMALLYSGLLSWTVWLHEEDVTARGKVARILVAVVVPLMAIAVARRTNQPKEGIRTQD